LTAYLYASGVALIAGLLAAVIWGALRLRRARAVEQALRLSEERYALAMAASGEGHWDWNIRTDEYYSSPRNNELSGLPIERKWRNRAEMVALVPFHPEDEARYRAAVAAHFAGETPRVDMEVRIGARWIHMIGMVQRDQAGRPVRWAGSSQDITEHKAAEAALLRSEERLRQAQRLEAMGTLAGGIAHDFNNILGAILGFGEMALRDAPAASRLRRDIENIVAAGERGRALVNRVLAFSRSGIGERVAVRVERIAREALEQVAAQLPVNIALQADLHGGAAAVLGDPTQVHQVVMNLATNAAQAMPDGGMLSVSLHIGRIGNAAAPAVGALPDGDYLVLRVRDTGTGIAPEIMDRIFDPFFTTKEVGTGTGLGLSLVHGIVSDLGGAVDVASTLGEGSVFTVYLPFAGDAEETSEHELHELPRGHGERVLIVDDEAPLVELARRTLQDLGYAPVGFTSSAAALHAFRAEPERFDVLITDERMPGMTGSSLIREVRGIRHSMPVILMSGFLGPVTDAGAHEVLKKPLSQRELAMSVARALEQSGKAAIVTAGTQPHRQTPA
jgi:signal transduction histidine kinase/ActR/RegA family two-component response regulator